MITTNLISTSKTKNSKRLLHTPTLSLHALHIHSESAKLPMDGRKETVNNMQWSNLQNSTVSKESNAAKIDEMMKHEFWKILTNFCIEQLVIP